MRRVGLAAALPLTVLAGCGGHAHRATLTVTPAFGSIDTPFRIHATGLPEEAHVTIETLGRSLRGRLWRSETRARADEKGRLDLEDQYLRAKLRPLEKLAPNDWLFPNSRLTFVVRAPGVQLRAHARRVLRLPSVSLAEERPDRTGFYGERVTPANATGRTAILLLGGSEGLHTVGFASILAGHGYPILALAYYGEAGLPRQLRNIPLEYFRRALAWMVRRPEVDPTRIVVIYGLSRGGEVALVLASTYPNLVHGAIGYVPSADAIGAPPSGVGAAWTFQGQPVYGPIPVERIAVPVFVVGAGQDGLWPSGPSVKSIRQRMLAHGRQDVTALIYEHAGHGIVSGLPNVVELSTTADTIYGTSDLGGSPAADEAAREDSWPRLLRFLARIGAG
jgi:dienelactone hydrolase